MKTRRLIILGSTGSIGTQTIEVVRHLNALAARGASGVRFEVVGLATGRKTEAMLAQAVEFGVREVAVANGAAPPAPAGVRVLHGPDAARELVERTGADIVMGAMVGSAGVPATLAALKKGADVALANKETLVAAGEVVTRAARESGAALLPVDSEHSAIWQCLAGREAGHIAPPCTLERGVRRLILTASGGALRHKNRHETYHASVEDALAHPNWAMGAKVTIDSASLTNKALEVIEAHWLFGLDADRIGVVIHPQSIVHSFVEYADGSVLAQMGAPDMKTPIQYALVFPARVEGCSRRLDFGALSKLDFEEPDAERFPALGLGFRVVREGGTSGAVFNGANEAAVEAFIDKRIPFGRVAELSREAMDAVGVSPMRDLCDATEADREARRFVNAAVSGGAAVR